MIKDIWGNWLWVRGGSYYSWTVDISLPPSDVIAETSLSKVRAYGSTGAATAFIGSYVLADPVTHWPATSVGFWNDQVSAPSYIFLAQAMQVTFCASVENMFAFMTWKLYFV